MKRLREISRFECDVRVLRNGFCEAAESISTNRQLTPDVGRYIASSDLVSGDVYELTDPALTQFPCDSLLLAGDCIVNESMLTG
jgi:cation-transporting ATPase 13A3/4/5